MENISNSGDIALFKIPDNWKEALNCKLAPCCL